MIHYTLGEGLAGGMGAKFSVEAKRLIDGEISLDCEHRRSRPLLFAEDLTTTLVENAVDTTNGVLGTLYFD
jgi:hypothetical protein